MHLCQVHQEEEEEARTAELPASSSLAITGNKAWQTRLNEGWLWREAFTPDVFFCLQSCGLPGSWIAVKQMKLCLGSFQDTLEIQR